MSVGALFNDPVSLNKRGCDLIERFERTGSIEDIFQAVATLHNAVEFTPDSDINKHARLSNLGAALKIRFEHLGIVEDIGSAVEVLHCTVELLPDGHPIKPGSYKLPRVASVEILTPVAAGRRQSQYQSRAGDSISPNNTRIAHVLSVQCSRGDSVSCRDGGHV